jgi:Xaa-Pro aminopeptidase
MTEEPAFARYRRVQAAMARRGVGALVLATPHLGAFASGARRVQVAGSGGTLPWVVVTAGASAAVVFTPDPDGAPAWMPRASVKPLRWERGAQLARIAELIAPTAGAVATDVLGPALAETLGAAAFGRSLVDAAPLLAEAAAPRSAAEVEVIVRALAAARAGLAAAAAGVRAGATVASVVARFAATMSRTRAGFPLSEGLCWRAGRRLVRLAPDDRLEEDDAVALELGLWVGGHAGVAGDTVATAGDVLAGLRAQWAEAAEALAAHCRAGASAADLRAGAAAAGAVETDLLAHGLGVGLEAPHIGLDGDDAVRLADGTVLVLAPVVASGVRAFRATRALLVLEGASRWLEPPP